MAATGRAVARLCTSNMITLPKAVQSAINRNAHRLALDKAYKALHAELEEMALNLVQLPEASTQTVIEELDQADVDYVPRSHLQEA